MKTKENLHAMKNADSLGVGKDVQVKENIDSLTSTAELQCWERLARVIEEKSGGNISAVSRYISVDESTLGRQRNKKRAVPVNTVRRLCLAYGLNANWLLGLPAEEMYHSNIDLDKLTYIDIRNILLKLQELGILDLYIKDYGQTYSSCDSVEYEIPDVPEYDFEHIRINDGILTNILSQYKHAESFNDPEIMESYQAANDDKYASIPLINWTLIDQQNIADIEAEILNIIKNNPHPYEAVKDFFNRQGILDQDEQ